MKWPNTRMIVSGPGIGEVDNRVCVEFTVDDETEEIDELEFEEADL